MQHYLFGYGSLFSRESRGRTAHTPHAELALLHGFKRSWCFHDKEGYSAVGITPTRGAQCNGVLVPVAPEHLTLFDKRELGYARVDVTKHMALTNECTVWTYVVGNPTRPTAHHPITQTYLDVILAGCLEYGTEVAKQFLHHTSGWEDMFVNDRHKPIFKRGLRYTPSNTIDTLLAEHGLCPADLRV